MTKSADIAEAALPPEWLVRKWARHLRKMRAACRQRNSAGKETPALRFIMQARDTSRFLSVPDGDGFMFAGLNIRLHGIDAPEYGQPCLDETGAEWPCGEKARWRLFELLKGREVCIEVLDVDCYGRLIARCEADGKDVAAILVREGWALALDKKLYGKAEQAAIRQKRNIWRGGLQDPKSWRQENALPRKQRQNTRGRREKASMRARAGSNDTLNKIRQRITTLRRKLESLQT